MLRGFGLGPLEVFKIPNHPILYDSKHFHKIVAASLARLLIRRREIHRVLTNPVLAPQDQSLARRHGKYSTNFGDSCAKAEASI